MTTSLSDNAKVQAAIIAQIEQLRGDNPLSRVTLVVSSIRLGWLLRRQIAAASQRVGGLANVHITTSDDVMAACLSKLEGASGTPHPLNQFLATQKLLTESSGFLAEAATQTSTVFAVTDLAHRLRWCRLSEPTQTSESMDESSSRQLLEAVFAMRSKMSKSVAAQDWDHVAEKVISDEEFAGWMSSKFGSLLITDGEVPSPLLRMLNALKLNFATLASDWNDTKIPIRSASPCSDPTHEVNLAVRQVVNELQRGVQPQHIAIVYSQPEPYSSLLAGELAAAGIQWHGRKTQGMLSNPSVRRLVALARSVADPGSVVSLSRGLVMEILMTGRVEIDGQVLESHRIQKFIERSGFYGDTTSWEPVLSAWAEDRDETDEDPYRSDRADTATQLLKLISTVRTELAIIAETKTWMEVADRLLSLLKMLGPISKLAESPLEAFLKLEVAGFASDEIVDNATRSDLLQVLIRHRFRNRHQSFGDLAKGVYVASIAETRNLVFPTVIVLGAADGLLPRNDGKAQLLPDDTIQQIRNVPADLLAEPEIAAREVRSLGSLLAAATDVFVHYPKSGLTRLSEGKLASCFTDEASPTEIRDDVLQLHPVTKDDVAVASVLAGDIDDELQLRVASAQLWEVPSRGLVTGSPVEFALHGPISASGLEQFLHCPHAYFVERVLGFSTDEYADEVDEIARNDFGTFLHTVLELFVKGEIAHGVAPTPGARWNGDSLRRLHEVYDAQCDLLEARGAAGWSALWTRERKTTREALETLLRADNEYRERCGLAPVGGEVKFGPDAAVDVAISLDGFDDIHLRGSIDRLDVNGDCSVVGVVDYKTGKAKSFEAGLSSRPRTRVQDLVYDAAARQLFPQAETVHVNFEFISSAAEILVLTAGQEERKAELKEILSLFALAHRDGSFPATPKSERDYCRVCETLGRRVRMSAADEDE